MTLLALLLKISVPPVLVALMSMAARRWGPTFGGLIMGLPWMTGPVLYFLGIDRGIPFLVDASRGAVLAVWGMGAFILCFGFAAARGASAGAAIASAVTGYVLMGLVTQTIATPLWLAVVIAIVVLLATNRMLPAPRAAILPGALPAWDIPARMVATFFLVTIIMISTDVLGPQRSGIVGSYPVILTVIGIFTLRQWGPDALLRVLNGISKSLLAFVGFFAVVGFTAPSVGVTGSYAIATATALTISGLLVGLNHRQTRMTPAAAE